AKLDESSTPTAAVLDVTNRYSFTDLSTCETAWKLLKADKEIAAGVTHAALAPRTSGKVKIDLPTSADADTLRVAFNHPAKGNVTTVQFALKQMAPPAVAPALPAEFTFPRL